MKIKTILCWVIVSFLANSYSDKASSQSTIPKIERLYQVHEIALQHFYKIDGNVADLHPSKTKRLEFLHEKIIQGLSEAEKTELYNDPDTYIFRMKRSIAELIRRLELLAKSGATSRSEIATMDRFLKILRTGTASLTLSANPFLQISELLITRRLVTRALDDTKDALENLQRLNALDKFAKINIKEMQFGFLIDGGFVDLISAYNDYLYIGSIQLNRE